MHLRIRLLLPGLALLLAAPLAAAQSPAPSESPVTTATDLPAWEQLSARQRESLIAPVRQRWNDGDQDKRAHMLEHAERWERMTPEQRRRARHGMRRWEHMSPEKRGQVRILFHHMRELPEAERDALRQRWKDMSPEQRDAWIEAHRPPQP